MLDLDQYPSLGAALRDALDRWPNEVCLIESDRDREKTRYTYSDFKEMALPSARALQDADLKAGDRVAIIMTNQSKWLISAYAIFFVGGVLVPIDYKLTAPEQVAGDLAGAGVQESQAENRVGNGSAAGRGSGGRVPLGGFSAQERSSVRAAAAGRCGLHRIFVGHGRAAEGMRAHPRKLSRAM